MSVTTTVSVQAGINTTLQPPRTGLYYTSFAIYNSLDVTFTVQNGVNQNSLHAQTAQLYAMPTTGAAPVLEQGPTTFIYGSVIGQVQVIWFEPLDTPGSYPISLSVTSAVGGVQNVNATLTGATDEVTVLPPPPSGFAYRIQTVVLYGSLVDVSSIVLEALNVTSGGSGLFYIYDATANTGFGVTTNVVAGQLIAYAINFNATNVAAGGQVTLYLWYDLVSL